MNPVEHKYSARMKTPHPDHVACPKCRHDLGKLEFSDTAQDKRGAFVRCPQCSKMIRLIRAPQAVRSRARSHQSKKQRLRERWAGREGERFSGGTR